MCMSMNECMCVYVHVYAYVHIHFVYVQKCTQTYLHEIATEWEGRGRYLHTAKIRDGIEKHDCVTKMRDREG